MDEKIVVPLDGSEVGESALPYVEDIVLKMAPEVNVEVTLLQVLARETVSVVGGAVSTAIPVSDDQMKESKNRAVEYLNKTGESLRSKGATVIPAVAIGDPSEEIVKLAEEINADLIAMSTHGHGGIGRWAFGSVTDKVLRREGKIPIAMVRATKGV